ncbi:alpha/beta hydrolase [Halalkalibacillus sediminis]|uniref:Alpha/beta hydrolase n=1 Tax=Halalkalibacillus sediminis TaxID=2018042 RepID=A0A2I0QQZ9_9BACI|nr:alpha/beta fold hydrolase [Halalkalibacillus sediminis]PKR76762.1 alpha/beta hydrolase [Halalkalibacillus sediminis]
MKLNKQIAKTSYGEIEYSLMGQGEPKVILVNGAGGPLEGWIRIMPELAKTKTVFAYNRLGVGKSSNPTSKQDGITIVETLREALKRAGLQPPYLLVGHSLGGLYVQLYAKIYPSEVEAVVFAEASHPKDVKQNSSHGKEIRGLNKIFDMVDSWFPSKQLRETKFVSDTVEMIHQNGPFPNIPVYVLIGYKKNLFMPKDLFQKRVENQKELLKLSEISYLIKAEGSSHFPQVRQPELLVKTIETCADQIRQGESHSS